MTTKASSVRKDNGASDRQWVVIMDDGAVSGLGRATDPSDEELRALEERLIARGTGGWLAIQSHSFYRAPPDPSFIEVRRLGLSGATFADAAATAIERHRRFIATQVKA